MSCTFSCDSRVHFLVIAMFIPKLFYVQGSGSGEESKKTEAAVTESTELIEGTRRV